MEECVAEALKQGYIDITRIRKFNFFGKERSRTATLYRLPGLEPDYSEISLPITTRPLCNVLQLFLGFANFY